MFNSLLMESCPHIDDSYQDDLSAPKICSSNSTAEGNARILCVKPLLDFNWAFPHLKDPLHIIVGTGTAYVRYEDDMEIVNLGPGMWHPRIM